MFLHLYIFTFPVKGWWWECVDGHKGELQWGRELPYPLVMATTLFSFSSSSHFCCYCCCCCCWWRWCHWWELPYPGNGHYRYTLLWWLWWLFIHLFWYFGEAKSFYCGYSSLFFVIGSLCVLFWYFLDFVVVCLVFHKWRFVDSCCWKLKGCNLAFWELLVFHEWRFVIFRRCFCCCCYFVVSFWVFCG